jgi:hypothetical protein
MNHKYLLSILTIAASFLTSPVDAQTNEQFGSAYPDKRRWAYGARLGWNFAMMSLDPKPSEDAQMGGLFGLSGGLEVRYSLLANLHLDGQLLYTTRNSRWEGTQFFEYASTVYLRYIDLPIYLQWYPMRGASQWRELPTLGLEPFIFAGPQISYLTFASHVVDFMGNGYYPDAGPNIADQLNPIEISAVGGGGLRWHLGQRYSVSAEGSLHVGLTDVNDSYTYGGQNYIGKNIEARWQFGVLLRP